MEAHGSFNRNPDGGRVHIWRAIAGGLLGTLVFGLFAGELAPRLGLEKLNYPYLLGTLIAGGFGFTENTFWILVGWLLFALGGAGWALIYAFYIYHRLPVPGWFQGLLYGGAGVFLISSFLFFPMLSWIHPLVRAQQIPAPGIFGLGLDGKSIVLVNFLGHCLFGFILGIIYRRRFVFS